MSEFTGWMDRKASGLSQRFWVLVGCFGGSLLFLLFQGGKLASMLFAVVCVISVYLVLGRWSGVAKAQGTRALSAGGGEQEIEAGKSLTVKLNVHVPGFWPVPYVMIKDKLKRKGGREQSFDTSLVLDWHRRGWVEYVTPPLRRGFYHFEATECSTEDIFGIFEHKGEMSLPTSFSVLPQRVPIKEWKQLHLMLRGMHHHSQTTRAVRETTQINGVREYIYGDKLSRIHWNATAKTGTWKSKEFERESLPKTMIVLDRRTKHYASAEQFERAVSVAASLFEYGMKRDLALGLLSVGTDSTYIEPRNGTGHLKSILNHLTDVEADSSYGLQRVLADRSRHFVPGTFMVIVSPSKGEEIVQTFGWLDQRQLNACHMWICGDMAEGRDNWTKQLNAVGYLGYAIPSLQDLSNALGGRS
ncbi:DUF58 domain-containing protein [Paenibacillus sp. MBLB4367]|uniref:DUF58 domain-containing protein n=1 Tax=Paenibacillus sp. MBLB4367 TaxID=3384767 RepID=UPI003908440E